MRIGIDGRALSGRYTGDRTYWLNLLRALVGEASSGGARCAELADNEYVVYSRLPIPAGLLPAPNRLRVRIVPARNDRLWTLTAFPRALREDGVELAHTQYTTPLRAACPIVTTVHDISFRLYPEWFPRKHRLLLNLTVPAAMRRAARVITDSESSRRDILRVYGLAAERVTAIPLAAGPEFRPLPEETARSVVKDRYSLADPYILSVGVLQPRKNMTLLAQAFALARTNAGTRHRLVLTGKRGWGYDVLTRLVCRLNVEEHVTFTDYAPDDDLPWLYSAADAVAYPSLYEGFGLPPVEAMACGAPTLVSDRPCMPEVAGSGAWVLPVIDAYAWADALTRLMKDPALRAEWRERGLRRADEFSWTRTACETLSVYRQAAEGVPVQ